MAGTCEISRGKNSHVINVLSTEIWIGLFSALIAILIVKKLYANYEIIEFSLLQGLLVGDKVYSGIVGSITCLW